MKKFLAVLLTAAAIFSSAQVVEPVTAHAQDVWVANDDSCDYYIMTETFKYLYADKKGFSVVVKFVTPDNSFVGGRNAAQWDFFFDDAQNGCWMCTVETSGRPFPASKDLISKRILDYCLENLY